jgi:hypothetical protein
LRSPLALVIPSELPIVIPSELSVVIPSELSVVIPSEREGSSAARLIIGVPEDPSLAALRSG